MYKNLLIKALSAILVISTFCAVFTGCIKKDGNDAESSGTTQATTKAVTEPTTEEDLKAGIDLSKYCIVRSKTASSEIRTAATVFKNFLYEYCGVNISVKTDDKAKTENEILFGQTNRAESVSVYNSLGINDWSVSLSNKKIVLAAGSNRDIANTTNYLVENCLKKNSRYMILGETPISNGGLPSADTVKLTLDGKDVNTIQISLLYKDGSYTDNVGFTEAALLLADNVRMETKITPTVYHYIKNPSTAQILIASAKNGSEYLPSGVSVGNMQYALCRNGKDIVIIANDAMGAEMGAQAIIRAMRGANGSILELNTLCKNSAVTYTYGQNLDLEKEGEYRIMTYNVERVDATLSNNTSDRYDEAYNSVLFYNPDVVGFQEFCVNYQNNCRPYLEAKGYTFVSPKPEFYNSSDTPCADRYSMDNNYTPIAYKTAKFDLLESGSKRIIPCKPGNSIQGNYGWPGYTVTWAVLKDKTSGDVFAVTALHNKTGSAAADQEKKTVSLGIVKGVMDNIVSTHHCPVFMVGDYNSRENMEDIKSFVTKTNNIYDSRYVSERGYSIGHSHDSSGLVVCSGTTKNAIDHIFMTGNARVLRHRYGHSENSAKASDHKPVFVDVIVGSAPIETNTDAIFTGFGSMKINKGLVVAIETVENLAIKKLQE